MVNTRTFISHSSTVSIHYSLEVLRANVSSSLLKLGFAHAYILQGLSGPGRWLLKLDVPALRNGSQFTLSPRILSTTTISNLTSTTALLRSMKGIIHISLWFFFKRHRHIRPNNTLYKLTGGRPNLKGDVIVMRIGSSSSYVNMRDRDTILTDWFMQRYGIGPCYRLPLTVCRFCSSALLKKRCLPKFLTYHKN